MEKFDYYKQAKGLIIKFLEDVNFIDDFDDDDEMDHICFQYTSVVDGIKHEVMYDDITQERLSDEEAVERLKGNEELAEKAIESIKKILEGEDWMTYDQPSDIDVWCREQAVSEICKDTITEYIKEHAPWFNISLAVSY